MTHNDRYGRVPIVCIVLDMQAPNVVVSEDGASGVD
jgi:hypothetical protein